MGRRRSAPLDYSKVDIDWAWQEHCRLAEKLDGGAAKWTEEFHAFTPRLATIADGRCVVHCDIAEAKWRGVYDPEVLCIRNESMAQAFNKKLGLPPPFPQALGNSAPSKFGFYCTRGTKFMFQHFAAAYAAKSFLDFIIDGQSYRWLRDDEILLDDGTRIRGERKNDLEEALEFEHSDATAQWEPPMPYPMYWNGFKGNVRDTDDAQPRATPVAVTKKKEPVAKKEKVARPDGLVSIGDIASELNVAPRVLRGILRSEKISKPAHGWAWNASEAEKIKSKLKSKL